MARRSFVRITRRVANSASTGFNWLTLVLTSIANPMYLISNFVICMLITGGVETSISSFIDRIFSGNTSSTIYIFLKAYTHDVLAATVFIPLAFILPTSQFTLLTIMVPAFLYAVPNANLWTYLIESVSLMLFLRVRIPMFRMCIVLLLAGLYTTQVILHKSDIVLKPESSQGTREACPTGQSWNGSACA